MATAMQDVRDKIGQVCPGFPRDVKEPLVLRADQVINAIRAANQDVPARRITRGQTDSIVRVDGKIKDPAQFARIIVAPQGEARRQADRRRCDRRARAEGLGTSALRMRRRVADASNRRVFASEGRAIMPPRTETSVIGMDIEQARCNMVEQQIRTWEVLDQDVLDLLFAVRREDFVPAAYRLLAFADLELPLGAGARMWSPRMEARVIQELQLAPGESVLEIGTGSGYFTALLTGMGARVTSVEIDARLSKEAKVKLDRVGLGSVELEIGDGARGWGSATYDAIVLTGSTPVLPDRFTQQLSPGGRVFAVVGEPPVMMARLVRWVAPGALAKRILFETTLEPLMNAATPAHFEF